LGGKPASSYLTWAELNSVMVGADGLTLERASQFSQAR
jgi:hypothetical protein